MKLNNKIKNVKGFIFDLDGTILDSMTLWHEVDKKYLAQYGIPYIPKYSNDIKGLTFDETAQYFIDTFNIHLSKEEIKNQWNEMVEIEYRDHIPCKEGIKELIACLAKENISMCVATSCNKKHATMALKRVGIYSYMKFIRTSDEAKKNKEYPDLFNQCAELMGLENHEIMVVEDLTSALQVAHKAGFKTLGIYEEHHSHEIEKIKEFVDVYVYSFKDLIE